MKDFTASVQSQFLALLADRFEKFKSRHKNISWTTVLERLQQNSQALSSLYQMEITGGEPDVVGLEEDTGRFLFYDCSVESPKGRRSFCYDRKALDSRKEHKPANSVIDLANEMGITLINEQQYRFLQTLGEFDLKTSSWVLTPPAIRELKGALFCDRRYNQVFVYHNGAESYYAARGFRAYLAV